MNTEILNYIEWNILQLYGNLWYEFVPLETWHKDFVAAHLWGMRPAPTGKKDTQMLREKLKH